MNVYDDGAAMWADLLSLWQDDRSASLVLPGGFSRERFLRRQAETTLWGERRVISLVDLWSELAVALAGQIEIPGELRPPEVEQTLAELIEKLPLLQILDAHHGGIELLASHLEWIEKQADLDYAPTDAREAEIDRLRERLAKRPKTLQAQRRSLIARHAKDVTLARSLIFPPLPESIRQLGGLLKGLGRNNRVTVFALGNSEIIDDWLARTGLTEEATVSHSFTGRSPAARLFTDTDPEGSGEIEAEWIVSDDQAQAAVEVAREWIGSGIAPNEICIVAPRTEDLAIEIAQAGRIYAVPVLVRDAVETHECPLGSLLAEISAADLADERSRNELLASGERYGLAGADLDRIAVARADGQARSLRALYELGRALSEPDGGRLRAGAISDYELGRASVWLDDLHASVRAVIDAGIEPRSVGELLRDAGRLRSLRGEIDGVALVSYAEVGSLQMSAAILCGLNEGEYPRHKQTSPFTSDELLARCPALAPADPRAELVAAIAAAERLAFVRGRYRDDVEAGPASGSGFWVEARRAFAAAREPRLLGAEKLAAPQLRARAAARDRLAAHAKIERAFERAQREPLPDPVGRQSPRPYSVTELETYLRCPLGWFVGHRMRPRVPKNQWQIRGNIAHASLAELLGPQLDPDDRLESVADVVKANCGDHLSGPERDLMIAQLRELLQTYSGTGDGGWPFAEHYLERPLQIGFDRDGDEVRIRGRVDRIDLREIGERRELLVIDYKLNSAGGRSGDRLQPYLYPLMAAKDLGAEPLGFLYVSIRQCRHEGLLVGEIAGIEQEGIRFDWRRKAQRAVDRALEAIDGIERGSWSRIGDDCPEWCGHWLLSETGLPS